MDDVRLQILWHQAACSRSDCNSGSCVHVADLVFPYVIKVGDHRATHSFLGELSSFARDGRRLDRIYM